MQYPDTFSAVVCLLLFQPLLPLILCASAANSPALGLRVTQAAVVNSGLFNTVFFPMQLLERPPKASDRTARFSQPEWEAGEDLRGVTASFLALSLLSLTQHGHHVPTQSIPAAPDSRAQLHPGLDFTLLTLEDLFTLPPQTAADDQPKARRW